MKVFISWSGERSLHIAKALHEWIPDVLQSVETWMSQDSIEAGERWGHAVASGLANIDFGIICVTPENQIAPWLVFEAGALAKSVETARVIPLLFDLDLKDLKSPLSQFQGKRLDKSHMFDVIKTINSKLDRPIDLVRLERSVDALWVVVYSQLKSMPAYNDLNKTEPGRSTDEILEELVERVSAMQNLLGGPDVADARRRRAPPPKEEDIWARVPLGSLERAEAQEVAAKLRRMLSHQQVGLRFDPKEPVLMLAGAENPDALELAKQLVSAAIKRADGAA